ncbi:restriction endonuclease subunit S [Escherichia coli]|uniref:restriction endonuclease subunit S n=1 Tax=Escherichia coli TaxID=562 RepID=UPI000BE82C32|nr:restriction endonuclease subunit S [Escherichia coli]EFM1543062.1 restriction endonuclease subunit S [Escherichia coli]EKF8114043.1 restriction endonuclease subunit S [Escherichia coli]EMC6814882.1 restriction endonuclease subunit S [Escherichia coli]MBB7181419.1 restriction endonuclease subunit S [Escherichia coli]HAI0066639.1 restriction endonuclease subunit S [Escherichia coli]
MSAGKLPEGWEQIEIGDIADVISGGTPKSGVAENFAPSGEGVAWLTPADLSGYKEKYISHGARDLTTLGYSSCSAKLMPKGTILFSSRAPIGYVAIAANEIATNQGFKSFVFPSDIFPDYAYYFLRDIRHIAEEMGTGTTFKEISGSSAKTLPFVLAPFAEQKIIAEKLDTLLAQVDSAKARLEQIPQILKRFRQAVLAAAVNGHLNKTAQSNTKKRTLQEVGIIIKTGPFGSALHKSDYISNGIPVINPMHINDGIISPSLSMTISDEKYAELSSWSLQDGDIIVGRRGEMGRAAVVNIGQSKMLCGTGSMILRTKKNIEPRYLELILRSPTAISYFNKEAVGSTMVNLNQKVINSLEAYIPNVEEQREIVRRVEQLFAYADTIEKQVNNALARVNNLTQSILAKAFRGELTAQWRAENPDLISGENRAAVLLEKIKAERAASGGKKASRKKS